MAGPEQELLRGWTDKARDAHSTSTTYFDSNIRRTVEANLRQFQGKHPTGSKYMADSYKNRSKLFRPKTRAVLRKDEAVCAGAYFASEDVVCIRPQNDDDLFQQTAADVNQALLQYRLTKPAPHGVPWFLTLLGAYQESMSVGVVVSKQDWQFDKLQNLDRPRITLKPVENIRIDPASDWTDPINSSPYVIDMVPMYIGDIKARMQADSDGQPRWFQLADSEIQSAIKNSSDTIRLTREGRTDSKDASNALTDYTIGWVHENIMKVNGQDYVFYTLGTQFILSEPRPLAEVYFHGVRPFVMGFCIIEPHKIYPSSKVELVKDTQRELNEIVNERRDNVKRMLDPRWKAMRNKQVDVKSLTRNVPSSVTLMSELTNAELIKTPDVTGACFSEQDRVNGDFDEIAGSFSSSSISSNRKLGETVGGLDLLSDDANAVGEYQLRAFTETWVEPVLRQMLLLERHYETSELVLSLAGDAAQIWEKGLTLDHMDALLNEDVLLTVNVGIGSTNPTKQLDRFITAAKAAQELLGPNNPVKLRPEEVIKEIFGKAGYKDGKRFYDLGPQTPDPMIALQQQALTARIALDTATAALKKANVTQLNVTSIYAGVQAAQVIASVPGIAPIADQLLLSGGFVDADAAPIIATPPGQAIQPAPGIGEQSVLPAPGTPAPGSPSPGQPASGLPLVAPEAEHNTDPMHPGLPESPDAGVDHGIETQRNDGVRK
jgi:hypothetical protein